MTDYVIGDVQGCYKSLSALLGKIHFSLDRDKLFFVGDLVNRGPQSLELLRFIHRIKDNVRLVLGNHDMHLLALAYDAKSLDPAKDQTLIPILKYADKIDMLHWLRNQPLCHYHAEQQTLIVHAGILPDWNLTRTLDLSEEVHQSLRDEVFCRQMLKSMYKHKPERFKESYRGKKRLRTIINVMTRIRFCKADGKQNFIYKGQPENAPEGYKPWFSFFTDNKLSFSLVFGHWAALKGQCPVQGFYAIDTGCVWGESLTAMRLSDKKCFSVDCLD